MEDKKKMSPKQSVKPVKVFRSGSVSLSLFQGTSGVNYVLQKSYKKDGEWHNSSINLFERELMDVQLVLKKLVKDSE